MVMRTLHYNWQEWKKHKWALAILVFLIAPVAVYLLRLAIPKISSDIINDVTAGKALTGDIWVTFMPYLILSIVATLMGQVIFQRVRIFLICWVEFKGIRNVSRLSFHRLIQQSMSFHNDRFAGSLVSQANKFKGSFEMTSDTILFNIVFQTYMLLFTVIILGPEVPWLVIGLVGFVALFFVVAWIALKIVNPYFEREAEKDNIQSGQLADSVSNMITIKSYGKEAYEEARYEKRINAVYDAQMKSLKVMTIRDICFATVLSMMNVFVVVFVIMGQPYFNLSIGTIMLIVTYCTLIINDLWDISNILRQFNRSFGNAQDMTKILDTPVLVEDRPGAADIVVRRGEVLFDRVTFCYPEDPDAPVLDHFDLRIAAGQRVGLVGRSGSGKTTLTKLLLRFSDVNDGEITIDGQNITDVTQRSLHENISYVPQEATLFHRTIRDNIAYGKPDATEEEIIQAARQANAWEFIQHLPLGLDTVTGERGVKLSGGQRQRLTIARAILKDAPILVLDEATSALDSESEKLIQDALKTLMQGRTSLVIAHRLSTVAELDRILVLQDGQIIEDGSHHQLIARDGQYAQLWNRQSGAFIEA
jgi:ATP-binding cassette subfamily B protein